MYDLVCTSSCFLFIQIFISVMRTWKRTCLEFVGQKFGPSCFV